MTLANTSSGKAQAGQSSGPLVPAAGAKGRSPAGAAGEKAKSPAEAKAHLAPQPSPGARTLLENLAPASKGEGSPHQKTEVEGVVGEETCGAGPCSCSAGQVRSPQQQFCLPGELLLAVQAHARQVEEGGRKESGKPAWPTTCHMGGSRGTEQELGGSGRQGLPPLLSSAREIGALKQEPELATILDCIGCAGKS